MRRNNMKFTKYIVAIGLLATSSQLTLSTDAQQKAQASKDSVLVCPTENLEHYTTTDYPCSCSLLNTIHWQGDCKLGSNSQPVCNCIPLNKIPMLLGYVMYPPAALAWYLSENPEMLTAGAIAGTSIIAAYLIGRMHTNH